MSQSGQTPFTVFGFEVPGVYEAPPRITSEGGPGLFGAELPPRAVVGGVDIGPFQNVGGTSGTILPEGGFAPDITGVVDLPVGPGRLGHIFRSAAGHVNPSTLASQSRFLRLFQGVASNPANRAPAGALPKAASEAGVQLFTQTFRSGRQVWVQVRNGRIINAGVSAAGP